MPIKKHLTTATANNENSINANPPLNKNILDDLKKLGKLPDDEIKRCHTKALKACEQQKVHAFIAYPEADKTAAEKLKATLEELSATKIEVFAFSDIEQNRAGEPYKITIANRLKEANWLIILFPPKEHDKDWIIFETGRFAGTKVASNLLISITRAGQERPRQIDEFHGFEATKDGIKNLLKQLITMDGQVPGLPAINREISNETLTQRANDIFESLSPTPKIEWDFYSRIIEIEASQNTSCKEGASTTDLPIMTAKILAANKIEEIFGINENVVKNQTFKRLISKLAKTDPDAHWARELNDAFLSVIEDQTLDESILSPFSAIRKTYDYVPRITSSSRIENTVRSIRVIFTPLVSPRISNIPDSLNAILSGARLATRFRWEIIEPYAITRRDTLKKQDIPEIDSALNRILSEAKITEVREPGAILREIRDENNKEEVISVYETWEALITANGDYYEATKEMDVKKMKSALKTMQNLKTRFMHAISKEIPGIIEKYWIKN